MEEKSRRESKQRRLPILLIFGIVLFFLLSYFLGQTKARAANAPAIITYQGKLLVSSKLATTTQSMYFILYDAAIAGTVLYTASGTIGTPQPVSTTPTQGLFSIDLGGTGTNALSQAIFQNNGSVYLEVRIGSDTLTPRKQITAAPYAYNAKYLDGVGVNTNSTTQYIPMSDTSGNFVFNSTTISSTLKVLSVAGVTTTFDIVSSTSGTSMFRVLSNGNVGIGTSTPTQKLSVVGNISNITDSNSGVSQISTTSVGGVLPREVFVSGHYAYTVNEDSDTISVIDVSNSTAPVLIATTSVENGPESIYVSGRYAYITNMSSSTVSVVDISNPKAPIQIATTSVGAAPRGIVVSGRYAYVVNNDSNSFSVVDVSNPKAPVQIATTSVGVWPYSVYVSGRYAYVANNGSSTISVVDISNPLVPVQVATTSVGTGPFSIYVSGRYAYTTNNTSNTISVIDISNPLAPTQIATTSVGSAPRGLFVSGRYAYVVNNGSNNISVVDISNPSAPAQIATTSVGAGPRGIFVSGRYAYVTNANSPSSLSVIDISGTEVSSLIAHSAEVGNIQSRNDIFAQGNIMAGTSLMVGAGGIMSQGSLSVFASSTGATSSIFSIDSAQTSNIFKVFANGNIGVGTSTALARLTIQGANTENPFAIVSSTGGSMFTVLQNGNVGIGTSTPAQKLSVVGNISNLIDRDTSISEVATVSVGINPHSIFISGRYAYVVNATSSYLSIIDISNPAVPVEISTTSVGQAPFSVFVSGRYAYTANNGDRSMSVVDISNPKAPIQVALVETGISPRSIYVSGKYAYVVNYGSSTLSGSNSISIVDISNPKAPVQIASTSVGMGPAGIYVSGRYAYVTNNTSGTISVVDVSNPSAPIQVATTSVGVEPNSIFISGRYAYVDNYSSFSISVVDISNPLAPVQVASVNVGGRPVNTYVSGRYAYTANFNENSISVVDISNPLSPILITTTSVGTSPWAVYVSGRYAYTANYGSNNVSVIDISGAEVSSLMAHSAEVGNIQSRNDIMAQGNIMAGTSLVVGAGGIMSQGSLSVFASSTGATSSIFGVDSAQTSNIFKVLANGKVLINTSTVFGSNSYALYVDSGGGSAGYGIGVVGRIQASGIVTSGTLDIAESYFVEPNCAAIGNCPEPGDVVCAVAGTEATIKKCSYANDEKVIGIISTNPGIYLGNAPEESPNTRMVALAGRVPVKISTANGNIKVGDKLAASDIPGVAVKAVDEGPSIGMAVADYASSSVGTVLTFVNLGWNSNIYKALTVDTASKTITLGTSTNPYDLIVTGNISMSNASVVNKLSFATSTLFESNVSGFSGARAFILNAPNFVSTSADNYIISLRSNNNPVFSVAANGDVHAKGNYYGASAVLGTSTNPGDLAERVDVAMDDTVEPGDVMVVDQNAPDTYRRSGSAYEQSVAGIISTNPTIVVGNGKTDYTAVMAMVGRVPVKVTNVNGNIQRGDLLITASTTGFAMKYDPAKDNNNKMVAVIGVSLESLNTSTGKILALIRTGWIYNRDQAINNLQNSVEQMATAQGINLASTSAPDNLNIANTNGQLVYAGGNFDLQNNSLINVAGIIGKDNKWRIDEWGNLIQKIVTAYGDKETYGLQSSGKQEIIISGTSTLENGSKKVILADLDQAIIDKTVPLKIQITMSGETKGVYVSERNYDSFVVKENENGQSNSSFDWTVIAKILPPDAVVEQTEQNNPASDEQTEQSSPSDVSTTTTNNTEAPTNQDLVLEDTVTTTVNIVDVSTTSPDASIAL